TGQCEYGASVLSLCWPGVRRSVPLAAPARICHRRLPGWTQKLDKSTLIEDREEQRPQGSNESTGNCNTFRQRAPGLHLIEEHDSAWRSKTSRERARGRARGSDPCSPLGAR